MGTEDGLSIQVSRTGKAAPDSQSVCSLKQIASHMHMAQVWELSIFIQEWRRSKRVLWKTKTHFWGNKQYINFRDLPYKACRWGNAPKCIALATVCC